MRILLTGGSGFIGTNLINLLSQIPDTVILNIDIAEPFRESHHLYWKECSLLDVQSLKKHITKFAPDYCIHLAAETSIISGKSLEEAYPTNTIGARNLFAVLAQLPLKRTLVISTQYVCGPSQNLPQKSDDYWPHTQYGESKVITEKTARGLLREGTYIILRPSYIWGPYHFTNFLDLVQNIRKRRYVHPAGKPVIRSYGYVKNICKQIEVFLTLETGRDWYYLGDTPIDSYQFVNSLSRHLIGKSVLKVPRFLLRLVSLIGDNLAKIPLNSFRYENMTTNYSVPIQATFDAIGDSGITLAEAAEEYADWLRENGYGKRKPPIPLNQ